ncbi:four-carbon acid sugar kinase family protein [Jannaschia sp. CCS1]|uniref:four-carbon acid sugar kinase family protein n=1 Tax=Jannaschia sp. (strain CCS1) TaxID=290400 RepID=UPI000053B1ED|nr:four-carbon acid sugar kinase family protein [Jannaschia sp. CCS1]ABD55981.1 type III effector Hrp-dependent outer domain protein [Jannaschia sp. CCS1]
MTVPRLAWYGDDFTGSAAVMDELAQAGLTAVLFTRMPDDATATRFAGYDAVGLAGTARTRGPAWMRRELPGVFDWMERTGADHLHYKICSTFDSSAELGSIGLAAEIGLAQLGGWAPCLTAAPSMGRWQCYGTLFARGPDGAAHRLDRHPVMRQHPSTPMAEADLARHLAEQTDLPIGLLTLDQLAGGVPERDRDGIVLLDAQREADMVLAGAILADNGAGLLLGSQGVEMALIAHWRAAGRLGSEQPRTPLRPARLAVVSGSVSEGTAAQITAAKAAGFATFALDTASLLDGAVPDLTKATAALRQGASILCHTALGPQDPRLSATRDRQRSLGLSPEDTAERIGTALGQVLARLAPTAERLVVAGGDSSGFVTTALGVDALTALAPVDPGAPLMRVHGGAADGAELVLKGGQMGARDLFVRLRNGDR